jgi:cholesterol transport system auxiliary component
MNMTKLAFIMSFSLLVAGCSFSLLGKAVPPPPYLLSLAPMGANTPEANEGKVIKQGDVITIATPLTSQAIAQNRIPVARDGTALAYIKDAIWIELPARLFQRLLSETVRARTGRPVLDPRQFAMDPGAQLSGHLLHFEVDEIKAEALVVFEATVAGGGKPTRTRRFTARDAVGLIDAKNAGDALNRAANKVAGDVAIWVNE